MIAVLNHRNAVTFKYFDDDIEPCSGCDSYDVRILTINGVIVLKTVIAMEAYNALILLANAMTKPPPKIKANAINVVIRIPVDLTYI